MGGKPAARKGDKTDHEDTALTPGPGAARTFINQKPAWRSNADTKECALEKPSPHVPEVARYGSYSVLIEGEMAIRVSDHCLGSTFPAEVTEGSPDVFVGNKLDGLGADIAGFCKSFCEMMKTFDELDEDGQEAALEKLMNEKLEPLGVPPIDVKLYDGNLGAGYFSFTSWKLGIARGAGLAGLSPADRTELGKVILHETRHAEQNFRAAQHLGTLPGADAYTILDATDLPLHITDAAANNPATTVAGRTWYESTYGSGKAYRSKAMKDMRAKREGGYERYRALASEHDAWDVDDLTNCTCED